MGRLPSGFWKLTGVRQYLAAALVVGATIVFAVRSAWPFDERLPPLDKESSIWEVIFHDPWVIGFIRIGLVAMIVYVLASVPALVVAKRWMKGLGTSGLSADDAYAADDQIEALQAELEESQEALKDMAMQYDLSQQLAWALQDDQEIGDNLEEEDGR